MAYKWRDAKNNPPKLTEDGGRGSKSVIVFLAETGITEVDRIMDGEWMNFGDDVTHWQPKPKEPNSENVL